MIIKAYKENSLIIEFEFDSKFYDLGLVKLALKYGVIHFSKEMSLNTREAFKLRNERRITLEELDNLKKVSDPFIFNILVSDNIEITDIESFYYNLKELELDEVSSFIEEYNLIKKADKIVLNK